MRAIIAGTGPSLTPEVIERVKSAGLPIFGCNQTFELFDLTEHMACNIEWWRYYWPRSERLRTMTCPKWTWDKATALEFDLDWIEGKWGDGLSTDNRYIHLAHSSGAQILGIAYHAGVREAVLVGYDMQYGAGYDGRKQQLGGARHYFGEYPQELQHWTKNVGPNGELTGLIDWYRTVADQGAMSIALGTPGSALSGIFPEGLI